MIIRAFIMTMLIMTGCATHFQDEEFEQFDHEPVESVGGSSNDQGLDVSEDIHRYSRVDRDLTEEELAELRELADDFGPGFERDALQVILMVQESLRDVGEQQQATIQSRVEEKGLDFPAILKTNPYLVSSDFFALALRSVEKTGNERDFQEKSFQAIRFRARGWMSLGRSLRMEEDLPVEVASEETAEPQTNIVKQISIDEIDQGNLAFEQAKKVADSGQYQDAIRMLENLAQTSPGHKVMAEEKIREICNLAVKELRHQAAVAFQNAVPMSNDEARARYLKTAQEHLQQALTMYPEADNLETVRQNLAVINSTLERMEGRSGA